MTINEGRNKNKNDEAEISVGIQLNSTTSTVISPANEMRSVFHVNSNFSNQASWVKLQAASVDNDKKGIYLNERMKGETRWDMPTDNIYTGEISAIAEAGTPTVYVTEY